MNGTFEGAQPSRFVRLITVRDETVATNLTLVGPATAFDANGESILFLLNSFMIDT